VSKDGARGGHRRASDLFGEEVVGGAVSGEAAEGGGDADGATGVGADGDEGGAFLDAGGGSGRRAAGEEGGVAGLEAVVAIVGVFAGDAVGELMEVGLAGDDGTGERGGGGRSRHCGRRSR
jgi:hypothetical protein